MKTSELIEQARKCTELSITDAKRCRDCPYNSEEYKLFGTCIDKLMKDLADRLEMAYDDLLNKEEKLEKYEKALDKACIYIEELTGSCPFDYNLIGCDGAECGNKRVTDCWKEWLLRSDAE